MRKTHTIHAGHDAADGVSDAIQVGDCGRIQQFVGHFLLRDNYGALFASDAHGRHAALIYRLESILYT